MKINQKFSVNVFETLHAVYTKVCLPSVPHTQVKPSFFSPQGQYRSCKEWRVHVYLRRKHVSERVNCAAERLHKPCIFLSLSPSSSQTKASCRESFSMLVSGSCGQSVTRAKRVWPPRDGNWDQQRQKKRALEPSATRTCRQRETETESEEAENREIEERERDRGWKEGETKWGRRLWKRDAAAEKPDRKKDR